jgi:hypothetical protein
MSAKKNASPSAEILLSSKEERMAKKTDFTAEAQRARRLRRGKKKRSPCASAVKSALITLHTLSSRPRLNNPKGAINESDPAT